jgi:hypothetical protein
MALDECRVLRERRVPRTSATVIIHVLSNEIVAIRDSLLFNTRDLVHVLKVYLRGCGPITILLLNTR